MPIYDYKCHQCDKVSEIFVHSHDSKDSRCPYCGSDNLERLISASYLVKTEIGNPGTTCCGRAERCEIPPCSNDNACARKQK